MSKMSATALELDESAVELGFADHLEAMANGYDWAIGDNGIAYLFKSKDPQELAHDAWLKEKSRVLTNLAQLKIYLSNKVEHFEFSGKDDWEILEEAIEFIEKGEC